LLNLDHPVKEAAASWARAELDDPDLVERDRECRFWAEGWRRIADHGVLRGPVAPEYGGAGRDLVHTILTIEGLGLGCRDDGLILAVGSQVLSVQHTLERFGSPEQIQRWLPELVSGRAIGAFSMSEPHSGSDAYSLTTTATPTSEGYRLDGTKAWVTMAPVADVFIVFASTNLELGRWGISTFLIPADTPGLLVGENQPKMGMRTTPFADLTFDGCIVPADARMGAEGAGASIFSSAMEAERAFLLAGAVGALERNLGDTIAYARTREQFGQPIGTFQAISHELAKAKLAHEAARTLLYKAAALYTQGSPSMMAAALAKLAASEASLSGALTAVQVHGARGYVTEFGVERDLRNNIGGLIYGGASGIQRNIVARLLGLPA
ncbi:MAG: acyl-CoA dehydrogenase, partial [Acidimicrobiia bacterium]|nr:acyl-CoA dehydrogenase [Acidimicrobiia bacterium]